MKAIVYIIYRDLHLALRHGVDSLLVLCFFVLGVLLFPLGVGPDSQILRQISSGVLWVMALLAVLLSFDRLFQHDYEDGSLELLALTPLSMTVVVLGKIVAHWLTTGLPLILVTPLLAIMTQMRTDKIIIMVASMVLGTPTLSLIGAIGAALVLGARRGGVLLSLLVLPLYIPVLIFGVMTVETATASFEVNKSLLILSALLCTALPLCPITAATALRQALEEV